MNRICQALANRVTFCQSLANEELAGGEGGGVIGLVRNFGDELAVEDGIVFIQHDDGACQ